MKFILLLLAFAIASVQASDTTFTPEQEARIQALISETLIANPDILAKTAEAWERQSSERNVMANSKALYEDTNSPRLGPKNARLTLVLFTDYNCPFCKRFDPLLEKALKQYPDIALVIKLVPYKGETSVKAARLALTTWRQHPDKFLTLHHNLMSKKLQHTDSSIRDAQQKSGVASVTSDDQSMESIRNDLHLAEQLGVQGTPATLVGNQMLVGAVPYETLEAAIKQQLAEKS